MVKQIFMLSNLQILFMLFLFIFRLLRRLFLILVQLFQNRGLFLRLLPFLGFYRFRKVGNGNCFARLCPLLQICDGGRLRRVIDNPVKIVVVLLYSLNVAAASAVAFWQLGRGNRK